jgi:hypothetical protein
VSSSLRTSASTARALRLRSGSPGIQCDMSTRPECVGQLRLGADGIARDRSSSATRCAMRSSSVTSVHRVPRRSPADRTSPARSSSRSCTLTFAAGTPASSASALPLSPPSAAARSRLSSAASARDGRPVLGRRVARRLRGWAASPISRWPRRAAWPAKISTPASTDRATSSDAISVWAAAIRCSIAASTSSISRPIALGIVGQQQPAKLARETAARTRYGPA